MIDFQFLKNPVSYHWVILAPRRAKRPDEATGMEPVCPFCPGREKEEDELFRLPPTDPHSSDWQVRVLPNKYPFAPIHEIVVHSPDHHKSFGEDSNEHIALILQVYRARYRLHQEKGQVYIFHNHGERGGESLPHPHSQITVIPFEVRLDIPKLDPDADMNTSPMPFVLDDGRLKVEHAGLATVMKEDQEEIVSIQTPHFYIFCPKTSQWPDEVWIAPKIRGRLFGETTDEQLSDLSFILNRIVQILDLRHGHEFPFNFYIYPGGDWYLRLIPRTKRLGGFEIGTNVYVNTQDPKETISFLKAHFENPDFEKIKQEQASYERHA